MDKPTQREQEITDTMRLLQEFFEINNIHPANSLNAMISIICLQAKQGAFSQSTFDQMMDKGKQMYKLLGEKC